MAFFVRVTRSASAAGSNGMTTGPWLIVPPQVRLVLQLWDKRKLFTVRQRQASRSVYRGDFDPRWRREGPGRLAP